MLMICIKKWQRDKLINPNSVQKFARFVVAADAEGGASDAASADASVAAIE